MKYVVGHYERYPTLSVDDYSWAEESTRNILRLEGRFIEIPDDIYDRWLKAKEEYENAENEIMFLAGYEH